MPRSLYEAAIARELAAMGRHESPREVEAWMRLEHGTLDALSANAFRRELLIAAECVKIAGPERSAELRASFGL